MQLLERHKTIEVVTNGQVSGYVFAETLADSMGEADDPDNSDVQIQEWVLFQNFAYPNYEPMTLRAVTRPEWRHEAFEGFVAQIERAHGSDDDWLFARVVASEGARQIDGLGPLALLGGDGEQIGHVYARGNAPRGPDLGGTVMEYWCLYEGYTPAPSITIRVGPGDHPVNEERVAWVIAARNEYSRYTQAVERLRSSVRRRHGAT